MIARFKLDEGGERRDNTKRFSYVDDEPFDEPEPDEAEAAPKPEKKTSFGRFDYNDEDFDDDTNNEFSASSDDEY